MSTLTYAVRDSATMLRRDILHAARYPLISLSGVLVPVLFLLLFAGVFGHTLRAGLGAVVPSGGGYIDYLTPGILLMTACSSAETTAVNMSTDMTEGIIARFRTMAITRTSVLTGQVLGGLIRAMLSAVLVVAVALALGFRPVATVIERTIGIERDAWILVAALSPELVTAWAAEKARQLCDPEFRRIYLACDEAHDWDPDDPRLDDLAAAIAGWDARKHDPEVPETADAADHLSVQLMTAHVTAVSPAWRRLNDLAHDRLWPTDRAPSTPPSSAKGSGPSR